MLAVLTFFEKVFTYRKKRFVEFLLKTIQSMNETAVHFTTEVMAFFAIMTPIANSSVFIGLPQR